MAYTPKTWQNNDIVKPEDLNRIEQGIANAETPPQSTIILYVSPSGNDASADGSSSKPFRTIQEAINAFPTSNDKSVVYTLNVAAGTYAGFTLKSSKAISATLSGQIIFTSDIYLDAGLLSLESNRANTPSINFSKCHLFARGGNLNSDVPTSFGDYTTARNAAIECSKCSVINLEGQLTISGINTAIRCQGATARVKQISTTEVTTGVSCNGGIVQIGEETISATTKFTTQFGGRIYVGAQTNIPNY